MFNIVDPINLYSIDMVDLFEIADGQLRSISLDKDHIYLIFNNPHEIVILDRGYKVLKKVLSRGEGPGEFMNPQMITNINNEVWVVDVGKYSIEIFDKELKYKTSLFLESRPWSITSNKSDVVVLTKLGWMSSELLMFKQDSTYKKSIPASGEHPLDLLGNVAISEHGEIFYSRQFRNENYIIDGELRNSINYNIPFFPKKSPTTQQHGVLVPRFDLVKNIFVDRNYIYALSGPTIEVGQPFLEITREGIVQKTYLLNVSITMSDIFNGELIGYNPGTNSLIRYNIE